MHEKSMSGVGKGFIILIVLALFSPLFTSAATCPNLYRNLSFGSRGQDVVELQNFLIAEGDLATGLNTGYFGRMAEAAVKSFQRKHNIVSSGTPSTTGYGAIGPRTRAKIASMCGGEVRETPPGAPLTTALDFSAYPLSGDAPLQVNFTSRMSNSHSIEYGDGNSGLMTLKESPCGPLAKCAPLYTSAHVYSLAGSYTAKLYNYNPNLVDCNVTCPPPISTVTITVGGSSRIIPFVDSRATVTLTSDKTTVTNGEKIRFTSTVMNTGTDPLVFFDEKSGQCQSSQFNFMFDGKYAWAFFGGQQSLSPAVCSNTSPTIITLLPGQIYSVYYDAEIPAAGNDESVSYLKNIPSGNHVVNAEVRLWGPGNGVFWEGKSNNINFNVQ